MCAGKHINSSFSGLKNTSRTNSLPLFHSRSYMLVAEIIRPFSDPPRFKKDVWERRTTYVCLEWRVFRSSAKQGQELGKWGRFLRGLDRLLHFLTHRTLWVVKSPISFQLWGVYSPFTVPLLFSTTWINRGWEMGRRARQEKGGTDPFGTCLPLTAHPSCRPSLRGLGALCQTTALQKGRAELALLIFIAVDLPQLMGNEAWAAEATQSDIHRLWCSHLSIFWIRRRRWYGSRCRECERVSLGEIQIRSVWVCSHRVGKG